MKKSINPSPWPFFVLTFAWSWLFWVPPAIARLDTSHFITQLGFALGGLGPMVFGLFFTYREGGWKGLRDYRQRIIDWKRLKISGWALSLLIVPLLTWMAGWMDWLLGGSGLKLDTATFHYFTGFLTPPLALPLFLVFLFLFGPVPEELGWRGYALDRLRIRYGSLGGSLILGLMWGLWHLPLFFLKGAYQATLGVGTLGFYLFFTGILALSVGMTWIYDLTGRSILSAILFHFSVNLTGTIAAHGTRVEFFRVLLCWVWALFIAVTWLLKMNKKTARNGKKFFRVY